MSRADDSQSQKMPPLLGKLSRHFRRRRMRLFLETFPIDERTKILDVGGMLETWRDVPFRPFLVLVNPEPLHLTGAPNAAVADGRQLPFPDRSFDIAFSNSVIEHVRDEESQKRFADEVMRVAKAYWVQTPHRWFPLEQHLFVPFVHWLPKRWQRGMMSHLTIVGLFPRNRGHREYYIEHYMKDVRLLSVSGLQSLFPQASILRERLFGISKAVIAVGASRPRD